MNRGKDRRAGCAQARPSERPLVNPAQRLSHSFVYLLHGSTVASSPDLSTQACDHRRNRPDSATGPATTTERTTFLATTFVSQSAGVFLVSRHILIPRLSLRHQTPHLPDTSVPPRIPGVFALRFRTHSLYDPAYIILLHTNPSPFLETLGLPLMGTPLLHSARMPPLKDQTRTRRSLADQTPRIHSVALAASVTASNGADKISRDPSLSC